MPLKITPVVLNILIINVLVFVLMALNMDEYGNVTASWAEYFKLYSSGIIFDVPQFSNADFNKFHPVQVVTAIFNHGGFMHLLFNMFGLLFIGTAVENVMGRKNFIILYLFSGVFGAILTTLFNPSPIPMVGASGAIFGVLGAFAYYYPNVKLQMMFIPIGFKAKYFVTGFAAISAVLMIVKMVVFFANGGGSAGTNATGELGFLFQISHIGHVTGYLSGLLFLHRNKILGIFKSR